MKPRRVGKCLGKSIKAYQEKHSRVIKYRTELDPEANCIPKTQSPTGYWKKPSCPKRQMSTLDVTADVCHYLSQRTPSISTLGLVHQCSTQKMKGEMQRSPLTEHKKRIGPYGHQESTDSYGILNMLIQRKLRNPKKVAILQNKIHTSSDEFQN